MIRKQSVIREYYVAKTWEVHCLASLVLKSTVMDFAPTSTRTIQSCFPGPYGSDQEKSTSSTVRLIALTVPASAFLSLLCAIGVSASWMKVTLIFVQQTEASSAAVLRCTSSLAPQMLAVGMGILA